MSGVISVNITKYKAKTSVNYVVAENYRDEDNAEHYDNGKRVIDTSKTPDNVFLLGDPGDYDQTRKDRIERVNEARAERIDLGLHHKAGKERLKASGNLQAAASREVAATRKLRADTVDTLGLVVQPSANFINALSRSEQTRFFRDSLDVMLDHPDWFGRVETAVIHYDEKTPHMQCLATTINEDTLTSDCQRIIGNKTKMSKRQTLLAEEMQKKGWDVERGIRRVDNPEYKNFKDEMEAQGYKINRFNDAKLMEEWEKIKQGRQTVAEEQNRNRQDAFINKADKARLEIDRDILKKGQEQLASDRAQYDAAVRALRTDRRTFRSDKDKFAEEREKVVKMANTASKETKTNGLWARQLRDKEKELEEREEAVKGLEDEKELLYIKSNLFNARMRDREQAMKSRELSITNRKAEAAGDIKSMVDFARSEVADERFSLQCRLGELDDMDKKLDQAAGSRDFEKMVQSIGNTARGLSIQK